MSTLHHHRRTPSALKTSGKGPRPGLLRSLSSPKIASSLGRKRTSQIELECESHDSEDDMTFLQYCPTCDKQIVVPNTSILYCSESCRRKDVSATLTTSSSSSSLIHTSQTMDPSAPVSLSRTIVPPLTPSTLSSFGSKPPTLHAAKSDLDPTEWKPDPRPAQLRKPDRPSAVRTQSAAQTYLAQFHRDIASASASTGMNYTRRAGLPLASTAPGLVSAQGYARGGTKSSTSSTESSSVSSSRESSVVGTPGEAGSLGRPLVYSASTATMALEVKSAAEGEMWRKADIGLEGGLKKLLSGGM